MGALICISLLGVGNFAHQAMQQDPSWLLAAEHSFFQAVAVGVYVLLWQK